MKESDLDYMKLPKECPSTRMPCDTKQCPEGSCWIQNLGTETISFTKTGMFAKGGSMIENYLDTIGKTNQLIEAHQAKVKEWKERQFESFLIATDDPKSLTLYKSKGLPEEIHFNLIDDVLAQFFSGICTVHKNHYLRPNEVIYSWFKSRSIDANGTPFATPFGMTPVVEKHKRLGSEMNRHTFKLS